MTDKLYKQNRMYCISFIVIITLIAWAISCSSKLMHIMELRKGAVIVSAILAFVFLLVLLAALKQLNRKTFFILVLLAGFSIKVLYVIYSPFDITKHDIGTFSGNLFSPEYNDGHFGYIEYIYKYFKLPPDNPAETYCFANPPLFYLLSALVMRITALFTPCEINCYESVQIIPLFCSMMVVIPIMDLLYMNRIGVKNSLLVITFCSFHPFFNIEAVTANNDILTTLLAFAAVSETARWINEKSIKSIVKIAVLLGLSIATKLNGAIVALSIGAVFIFIFIRSKEKTTLLKQFALFLLICIPIGLFFPIRNYIKFGLPLTYTQTLNIDSSWYQYVGYFNPKERLIYLNKIANIWYNLIRTSLVDELAITDTYNVILMEPEINISIIIAFVMSIFMLAALCWFISKKNRDSNPETKVLFGTGYLFLILSYVIYCFKEPFICTMNFRYITVALLIITICYTVWMEHSKSNIIVKAVSQSMLASFTVLSVIIDINLILLAGTCKL